MREQSDACNIEGVCGAADAILNQCGRMIELVDDGAYATASGVLRGGTIGKHVRHALDHYCALLDCDGSAPVDYDHRDRATAIETDRAAACGEIDRLRGVISGLDAEMLGKATRVRVMLSGAGEEAVLDSTIGRELFFATHHAIHHQAMIKAIAAEHGAELDGEFGTAPSTINHERTNTGA